jgi:predicted Zn-dependent protease
MARSLNLRAAPFLACIPLLAACATDDVYEAHQSAVLAYDKGEDARAEALYQGLARSAPNDPEIWLRLGNLYARSNQPDNAAEAYQRGLLLAPGDSRLWYNLGIIRQRQAHAALIQTYQLLGADDPAQARIQALIERLAPAVGVDATPAAAK